jgi:outer membrane lipoprotein SlyB
MSKTLIWIGLFVGSTAGGYLPALFGGGSLSMWGVLGSVIGGVAGVLGGHKLGQMLGV